MKTALKIIGGLFVALILIGNIAKVIVKSSSDTGSSIVAQIERANRDCPIPVANGVGQVTAIKFEDNDVTYYLDYKKGYFNLDAYTANPDAARELFYLSFVCLNAQGNQTKIFRDELKNNGYGVKVIVGDGTGKRFVSELTSAYITNMDNRVSSDPSKALHDGLALKLQLETEGLPIKIEEGLTITKLYLEDNNIVNEIIVDEDLYDISAFRENMDVISSSMMEEANNGDPESGALLDLCKVSHTGLIYRMIGERSKQSADVILTSEFIRTYRNIPSQVNIN
jgi:hypothetical protein